MDTTKSPRSNDLSSLSRVVHILAGLPRAKWAWLVAGITATLGLILVGAGLFRAVGLAGAAPNEPLVAAPAQNGEPAAPEPVQLTDQQDEYPLGLHLEILEDPGGDLTIEEAASPEFDPKFTPSQDQAPNYGFTTSAYWARLSLENDTLQTVEWLLEVDFANMHYVDLYTPLPDGDGYEVRQTGKLRPVSTRDVFHPQIVFDLLIPTQSQQTYYLRFENGASMALGLTLWNKDAFLIDSQTEHLWHGLFFGFLICLLFYNLFFLLSLRELVYLYFVLEIAAMILMVASYDGYLAIYSLPSLFFIDEYAMQLSFSLLIGSIILFADAFLEMKIRLPKLHLANLILVAALGLLLLLTPFFSYHLMTTLVTPLAVLSLVMVLVGGIASLKKGFRPARFFLIAWAGLLVSLMIVVLVRMGVLAVTPFRDNLFRLGMIWLGACWSFALLDRINLLRAETTSANQDLRQSRRRLSEILEGLPLGVVLYGKDLKPNYMNRRTANILSNPAQGIRPDLAAGRTLAQAIKYFSFRQAGSDHEYSLELFPVSKALQGEHAYVDDIVAHLADQQVPLEIWASPVKNDAGEVESVVVAFQDITQRKKAEAELEEYRKQLEALVEIRTAELSAVNERLHLHLDWLSAVNQINQMMASSADFKQIYDEVIEIINRLFSTQDAFIAEIDPGLNQLKFLAHSCRREAHPDLVGSITSLSEASLSDPEIEAGSLTFITKNQLRSWSGPIGAHFRDSQIDTLVLVPLRLRESVSGFLGLEVAGGGRVITREGASLLSIFSNDIAQIIQASRLFEQTRALITEEERNRLARELHDSVTQTLFTASVLAESTPRIWEKDPGIARQNLDKLALLIRGALAEMRSLLIELRSGELHTKALDQLLITLGEAARARTHAVVSVSVVDIPELPKDVTTAFYRIAQEGLNNAIVHAAASHIQVSLLAESGRVMLQIRDDGCGFDPKDVPAEHLGIRIMLERAAKIGGEARIDSQPGHGTEIAVAWPGDGKGVGDDDGG